MLELQKYNATDATSDRYNQTRCGICFGDYVEDTEEVKKVRLACEHIFHKLCIPDNMLRCPICLKPIAGRITPYTQREIEEIVDQSLTNLVSISYFWFRRVLSESNFRENLIRELEQRGGGIFGPGGFDPIEFYKNLNESIPTILEGNENRLNILSRTHILSLIHFFNKEPIRGERSDGAVGLDGLKGDIETFFDWAINFIQEKRILKYIENLKSSILQDSRIIQICENRKQQFIALVHENIASISPAARIDFMTTLSTKQLKILNDSNDPLLISESQNALDDREIKILRATMTKLALTALLMMIVESLLIIKPRLFNQLIFPCIVLQACFLIKLTWNRCDESVNF